MKEILREFFGIGGYTRQPEGFLSWQHLVFVTSLMVIMVACAIFFGKKNKLVDDKAKNKVLIWSAFLIDGFELFKIFILCFIGSFILIECQNIIFPIKRLIKS